MELPPSYFLSKLIQRHKGLESFTIEAAYPNYGIVNGNKSIVFTHGHFIESLYHLLSEIKTLIFPDHTMPLRIENIEAENFAWIDFFWSSMGRSAEAGKDVERVYEYMQNWGSFKRLLSRLASTLAKKYPNKRVPGFVVKTVLRWLLHHYGKKLVPERTQTEELLSKDGIAGLKAYMKHPLRKQIDEENVNPTELTLVIGHTHKPFEIRKDDEKYGSLGVNTYNTGGWVVDTDNVEKVHGASMVLINENLNISSVRLYNESEESEEPSPVRVETLDDPNNDFYQHIKAIITSNDDFWNEFADTIAAAVMRRRKYFKKRIEDIS